MARRPTDEEAWVLEKIWTENPPELADESPMEGTGPLTRGCKTAICPKALLPRRD